MPDIFVPLATDSNMAYYNRLINRGIVYDFAFDYTDSHREELNQYQSVKDFDRQFKITTKMFDDFLAFAEKEGVARDEKGIAAHQHEIKTLTKALIARNILDDDGFYPIYHRIDETFQEAVKTMKSNMAFIIPAKAELSAQNSETLSPH
jgi:carboxyl-terminal processing protease